MNNTIDKFLESKEITAKELKDNFELVREIDIDMSRHKGCPNCNNKNNLYNHPSSPWTNVSRCISCSTIMITFVADRMGGAFTDTVVVYKNKPLKNNQ